MELAEKHDAEIQQIIADHHERVKPLLAIETLDAQAAVQAIRRECSTAIREACERHREELSKIEEPKALPAPDHGAA